MRTSISEQENESHRDVQPCPPENFGGLFAGLSEISGEGESLLSLLGLWSSAITRLTGAAHLRYLKDDKQIFVIVRRPANR
jgi:hypothetical protein